jgi:uncharacterized protein involved in exopolysaccharide biosynthesis
MRVEAVGTGAMRRIVLPHPDPVLAKTLLMALYRAADDHLRHQAKTRTETEIAYVQQALRADMLAEHRTALINVLSAQEQTMMMLRVDLPFAADLIQPPQAPSMPDWPNPLLVLVLSVLLGGFAGLVTAYARNATSPLV